MSVTLRYPITGTVTASVELPYPAQSVAIEVEANQLVHRAGAGFLWTSKVGPTIYRIRRAFEALTETQAAALFAFFETIDFSYNRFLFCYISSIDGLEKQIACRLSEPPGEQIIHLNNRDVSIVSEQYVHHDAVTEATEVVENAIIDEADDSYITDEADDTVIVDEGA